MATLDFTSVATDMARLKAYQDALKSLPPTDLSRGMLQAEVDALQSSVAMELEHAQRQADATSNMFQQMQWTNMLGQSFSGLANALPSIIALIK